jgi:3-methylcrotonyl-CoA carboxylase alpha subunit
VRVDAGIYEGATVSIHYDPMLAKLIVWGSDRDQALARLARALGELRIEGIATNVPLFRALVEDEEFRAGRFDITWLDRRLGAGELARPAATRLADLPLVAAAIAHHAASHRSAAGEPGGHRPVWRLASRRAALRGTTWSW